MTDMTDHEPTVFRDVLSEVLAEIPPRPIDRMGRPSMELSALAGVDTEPLPPPPPEPPPGRPAWQATPTVYAGIEFRQPVGG